MRGLHSPAHFVLRVPANTWSRSLPLCIFSSKVDTSLRSLLEQRLVQLSQANARLSSEGAGARGRLADAEDVAEKHAYELDVGAVQYGCARFET